MMISCDICGKDIEDEPMKVKALVRHGLLLNQLTLNLCPECAKEVESKLDSKIKVSSRGAE